MAMKSRDVSTITRHADLASRATARLEQAAEKALHDADAVQAVKMIADGKHVRALVSVPGMKIQFEDGIFSVDVDAGKQTV